MPHKARSTSQLLLLLVVSLASVTNVSARALPQFYPGSNSGSVQSGGSSSSGSEDSMNIENDGIVPADEFGDGVQIVISQGGGGVDIEGLIGEGQGTGDIVNNYQDPSQRVNNNGPSMELEAAQGRIEEEEEEEQEPDQASFATQADEFLEYDDGYADAGYYPDQSALDEDLLYTGGGRQFDVAPEGVPRVLGELLDTQSAAGTNPVGTATVARQGDTGSSVQNGDAPAGSPLSPAGEYQILAQEGENVVEIPQLQLEEQLPNPNAVIYPLDTVLDPEDVVNEDNEVDADGNMRILTEAPDLDAKFEKWSEEQRIKDEQEKADLRAEREAKAASERRNRNRGGRGSEEEILPKYLPDDQLPPEAFEPEIPIPYRNNYGEIVDEYGFRLDENGERIPEVNAYEEDDRARALELAAEAEARAQAQANQANTNAGAPENTDEEATIRMRRNKLYNELKKPTKYRFQPNLSPYLNRLSYKGVLDYEDVGLTGTENVSDRNRIINQPSINFRKPPSRNKNKGQKRTFYDYGVRRQGPRVYRDPRNPNNPYNFPGQPYVNNLSAQDIEDAMVAEAALNQQQSGTGAVETDNQESLTIPPSSVSDPFNMSPDKVMQLFELQQQKAAAEELARNFATGQQTTQNTMASEAEAGTPRNSNLNQRLRTGNMQLNDYFDPNLYGIANEAFGGGMNGLAGMGLPLPPGGSPFDFDLNYPGIDLNPSTGNQNPSGTRMSDYYDENLFSNSPDVIPPSTLTPQPMARTGAQTTTNRNARDAVPSAATMTEFELIDFLTRLEVPIGVGEDVYPVPYLRQLVAELLGEDVQDSTQYQF
ncbi:hypothetical protein TWF730_001824 [Orbilia blumenaviensis]|uniref:Uncharacterized protein n=1 Tax=Orbilia blumenaviensis TaxID=1796055 RepID=A0AAV9UFZ0_9PEZI